MLTRLDPTIQPAEGQLETHLDQIVTGLSERFDVAVHRGPLIKRCAEIYIVADWLSPALSTLLWDLGDPVRGWIDSHGTSITGRDFRPLHAYTDAAEVVDAIAWATVIDRWGDPTEWDWLPDSYFDALRKELSRHGLAITEIVDGWIGIDVPGTRGSLLDVGTDPDAQVWGITWANAHPGQFHYGWLGTSVDTLPQPVGLGLMDPEGVAAEVAVVLPHAPAWDHHSPSDVVSRLTAYAALTALDAALPAPRPAGFKPIPDQARDAGAAGLAEYWPGWDADTECDAPLAEHDHENCYPMAWWPDRAAVAAAVVRGLVDAGWTLTPPAGGTS